MKGYDIDEMQSYQISFSHNNHCVGLLNLEKSFLLVGNNDGNICTIRIDLNVFVLTIL